MHMSTYQLNLYYSSLRTFDAAELTASDSDVISQRVLRNSHKRLSGRCPMCRKFFSVKCKLKNLVSDESKREQIEKEVLINS